MKLLRHPHWLTFLCIAILLLFVTNALLLAPAVSQLAIKGTAYTIAGLSFLLLLTLAIGWGFLLRELAHLQSQNQQFIAEQLTDQASLNDFKLQFVSILSHEFRTPLSAILMSAQLLDSPKAQKSETKRKRNLNRIQSSVKSLNQLMANLLLLTRAEAGQLELNPQELDLPLLCQEAIAAVKKGMSQPPDIVLVIGDDCEEADLDGQIIRSILISLLHNTLQYSPPESQVTLRVVREVNHIRFQVADQGMGIPVAEQVRIFEPFERGENVNGIPGNGLGLAVVKACVELHGGAIALESQPDEGTTVTVDLPCWS